LFGDIKYVNQDYQYDIKVSLYGNSKQEEILNKIKNFVPNLKLITTKTQNIPIKEIEDKNFTKEYLEILSDDRKFPIISVVLLDDNSYHEYLKTLKLTKETSIFVNKISLLQMDGSLKSVKIFNDSADIDFIFGEEGYYKSLDTVFLTDKTPDIPASLEACLFVNKELYNELGGGDPGSFPSDGDLEIYTTTDEYKLFDQKMHSLMMEYDNGSIYYENLLLMLHQLKMNILAIQFAIYSFIGFITLIGVTSVFNTINTSINLRRIEFSVLRSVGLSPKGFNKMIRLESVILGIKALLYGITISLGIIYITSEIFKLEDYLRDIKVPFPKTEIIIAVFGVFTVIFITMFYATRKLKDQNIIDEIRQENI
jgi:putative ABC transport system permease protein